MNEWNRRAARCIDHRLGEVTGLIDIIEGECEGRRIIVLQKWRFEPEELLTFAIVTPSQVVPKTNRVDRYNN